jgi:hypothetical protein
MPPDAVRVTHATSGAEAGAAACRFLRAAQSADGSWHDFLLPAGASNVWVTAFVGGALAAQSDPACAESAWAAWRFLEGVDAEGGWSYNPTVPGDGDSTLWGLRLAQALGADKTPRARAAARFLDRHIGSDGGVATYASADAVRRYIGLPAAVPFDGWTQSHRCVTAACANLTAYRARLLPYLLSAQAAAGHWPAYWWFDDEIATAEAVAALATPSGTAHAPMPEHARALERAVGWAQGRVRALQSTGHGPPPLAFALAHALRVLARGAAKGELRRTSDAGLARLIGWQRADGSWPGSARLRVPRPDRSEPDGPARWTLWAGMPPGTPSVARILAATFDIYSPDHRAVYTTATVLRALQDISRHTEVGDG